MPKKPINKNKIVVISGSGISAESGIPSFRFDDDSLWNNHDPYEVATIEAWKRCPEKVISFFNELKLLCLNAKPNAAHIAIAELEAFYQVTVITTNLDTLHEQAGSTNVLHLHGDITKARSQVDNAVIEKNHDMIQVGELCEHGSQVKPDVVLFGERVDGVQEAKAELKDAGKVLVIGTSLTVKPASGIPNAARGRAEKIIVNPGKMKVPYGYRQVHEQAGTVVPRIVQRWIDEAKNRH